MPPEHDGMPPDEIELICRDVVEMVTEYLGQTLAPAERQRFEHHLSTCPPCTSYLAQMRVTLELAGDLGKPEAADQAERELASLFRRWHQKK